MVHPSPWPFFVSINLLVGTINAAAFLHDYTSFNALGGMMDGFWHALWAIIFWLRDVVREGTFQGHHHPIVQSSLRLGMLLFIVSEIMFFFAFFWAFFHSSLAPSIVLGCTWPPINYPVLNPYHVPLLNTAILLTSGATITLAHHALLINRIRLTSFAFILTIILAVLFTALQVDEYQSAPFSINDGVYGSTFYMATGFHGFHVIIGTIFIFVSYRRFVNYHLTPRNHFGFEASAWYWHFVDVVWLFLYLTIYIWGSY